VAKLIVSQSFDYRHPNGMAVTALKAHPDAITVKREIADYAVANGFGDEPKADGEAK
jgi:hypothetical protein